MAPVPAPARRRLARVRAWAEGLTWLAVSGAYGLAAYAVVFQLRLGRVIAGIDEEAGRGVHAGDVLALPLACTAALGFVLGVAALDRATRPQVALAWRGPARG